MGRGHTEEWSGTMLANRTLGLVFVIIGVLANNYVYLHDIIFDKEAGSIYLGWLSWVGISLTLLVVAFGILMLLRSQVPAAAKRTHSRQIRLSDTVHPALGVAANAAAGHA